MPGVVFNPDANSVSCSSASLHYVAQNWHLAFGGIAIHSKCVVMLYTILCAWLTSLSVLVLTTPVTCSVTTFRQFVIFYPMKVLFFLFLLWFYFHLHEMVTHGLPDIVCSSFNVISRQDKWVCRYVIVPIKKYPLLDFKTFLQVFHDGITVWEFDGGVLLGGSGCKCHSWGLCCDTHVTFVRWLWFTWDIDDFNITCFIYISIAWSHSLPLGSAFITLRTFLFAESTNASALLTGFVSIASWKVCFTAGLGARVSRPWCEVKFRGHIGYLIWYAATQCTL